MFNPKNKLFVFIFFTVIALILLSFENSVSQMVADMSDWAFIGAFVATFCVFVYLTFQYRHYKRYGSENTIITQFDPPQGLHPVMVGFLQDCEITNNDILAGLVYLAENNQIVLEKIEILNGNDYTITLKKDVQEIGDPIDRLVLRVVFGDETQSGSRTSFSRLAQRGILTRYAHDATLLTKDASSWESPHEKALFELTEFLVRELETKGLMVEKTITKKKRLAVTFVLMILFGILGSLLITPDTLFFIGAGFFSASIICFWYFIIALLFAPPGKGVRILSRTKKGDNVRDYVVGFHKYLDSVGKYRYLGQQVPSDEGRALMNYLPYAIATGAATELVSDVQMLVFENRRQ